MQAIKNFQKEYLRMILDGQIDRLQPDCTDNFVNDDHDLRKVNQTEDKLMTPQSEGGKIEMMITHVYSNKESIVYKNLH